MNKFLQKVAKIFLGLSMAAGVGVAVSTGRKDASKVDGAANTYTSLGSGTAGTNIITWTVDSGAVTVTLNKGSSSNFYTSSTAFSGVRYYIGNVFAITAGTNYKVTGVKITLSGSSSYAGGYLHANTSWSGGTNNVTSDDTTDLTLTNCSNPTTSSVMQVESTNSSGVSAIYLGTTVQRRPTKFEVKYSSGATNYTVTFYGNGSTGGSMSTDTTTGASYTAPDCSFTKTNHVFSKWALGSASGTQYATGEIITGITGAISLYAIWMDSSSWVADTFDVTDLGGTTSGYAAFSVPGTSGATYVGYCMKNSTNIQFNTYSSSQNRSIATSVSGGKIRMVSVSWGNANSKEFTVYCRNSAYANNAAGNTGTAQSKKITSTVTDVVISDDYTHVSLYPSGAIYPASVTFYWEVPPKYTVSFSANNSDYTGATPSALTQATAGAAITLPGALSCTGYTWLGWNTSSSGGQSTRKTAGSSYTPSSTHTLFGEWQLNSYTVDGSGITNGSLSSSANINHGGDLDISIEPVTNYTYPSSISVTMGGNDISGDVIYDDSDGSMYYTPVTGNIVITAACIPEGTAYTVTYDPNEGTVSPTSEEIVENGHPSFPTPTRSGYKFKGWQVNGSGTAYIDPEDYTVTGDVTFVASWTAVYTITFNANGGSSTPASKSIEDGSTFTFPSAGTKTHYSFSGWKSPSDSNLYAVGATSPAVTAAITYTAQWTPDAQYDVTYSAGDGGSGSFLDEDQWSGSYTLKAFANLTGVSAQEGYQFKNYTVGGADKNPGDIITLSAATAVTINFEEKPVVDLLRTASTSLNYTTSSYGDISGRTKSQADINSEATYAGHFMCATSPNAGAIQLNPSKSTYICTTASSQNLDSISITFKNANSHGVNFYGSNTAYTATYNASGSADSTLLHTSTSNDSFTVSGSYKYLYIVPTGTTYVDSIEVSWKAVPKLKSVATSGQTTSFTHGDSFAYGGTLTASYTGGKADASVTPTSYKYGASDINPASAGTAITVGTSLSVATHNGQYIYVGYTEGGITKWTTGYQITVSYSAVTDIILSQNTAEIGLNEIFDYNKVGVTVSPSSANPAVTWSVSANTVGGDYTFNALGLTSGSTEGTITLKCESDADSSKFATLVITISGEPIAEFSKDSTSGYAGKNETISFTYGNINDEDISILSSNTSYVTIGTISASNGSGTVVINFVGAGSTSVTIGDGNSTLDTLTVIVSDDSVTSVTWSASNIDVYSGATLSTTGWNVQYEMASGDTGSASNYAIKLGSATVTAGYVFQASDDGKTMHVEYGGVSSSSITVTVTQRINNVYAPTYIENDWSHELTTKTWSALGDQTINNKLWTVAGEDDGTDYAGWDATKGQQFGSGSHPYESLTLSSSDFSGTVSTVKITTSGAKDINATVSVSVGGTAFKSSGNESVSISATSTEYTFTGVGSGTITISWANSSSKAIYFKALAVTSLTEGESVQIANSESHKAAQRVAVAYATAFNDAMDDTENCTTGLDAAWTKCQTAYNTFKTQAAALGASEEEYAKNLVKYATRQYSDDSGEACLERMMKTYEVMVQKHGKSAYMSELVTLGAPQVSPLINMFNGQKTNTVAIIVIISMVSMTAIGGYFFLRKRKENN